MTIVGLLSSWSTTALSFFADLGLTLGNSEISIVTILSGLVSSCMTLALAFNKYTEGLDKKQQAEIKRQEARKLELENDKTKLQMDREALEVQIIQIQLEDLKNGKDIGK